MAKFTTDYVFNTATHMNGMTKNEMVCFHLYSPNGLVSKLPDFDDFLHGDVFLVGCQCIYGRHNNHHAEWLRGVCNKPKSYTKWSLMYHLTKLADDVEKAPQVIADAKAAA